MRISCIQMNMLLNEPERNFAHAEALIREAVKRDQPDVAVLPETFQAGFEPVLAEESAADREGEQTRRLFSALSRELNVNIVAGSVANRFPDGLHNTAYIFDRAGNEIASYDKTHLFSPMGEKNRFVGGNRLTTFQLDGVNCGIIICYDLRFPELTRSLALKGMDVLFLVSQWPIQRAEHLSILSRARAIENQCFVAVTNSCGQAGKTRYGGGSALIDPLGQIFGQAGTEEEILTLDADVSSIEAIRKAIPVFADRRPELYKI